MTDEAAASLLTQMLTSVEPRLQIRSTLDPTTFEVETVVALTGPKGESRMRLRSSLYRDIDNREHMKLYAEKVANSLCREVGFQ